MLKPACLRLLYSYSLPNALHSLFALIPVKNSSLPAKQREIIRFVLLRPVSYTHLTLPTIYSV